MKRFHDTLLMLLLIYISCIPVLFLPFTQDYYDTTKWYALLIGALGISIVWMVNYLKGAKHMHVSFSPVTVGLLGIAVAGFLSVVISSPNKIEALLTPMGPVTFLCMALVTLLIPAFHTTTAQKTIQWSFFTSVSLLALVSVYQFFGLGKIMLPSVPFLADPLWTPTGSAIASLSLFILTLPILLSAAVMAMKEKHETAVALTSIMVLLIVAATGVLLWQIVPKLNAILLPQTYGWAIMLEILKNTLHAIFGIGAENFLTAFSIGRPLAYNLTPFWSVRFVTNSNFLFHITTIYGILGCVASVFFLKGLFGRTAHPLCTASRILSILILLLTPPTITVLLSVVLIWIMTIPYEHKLYSIKPIHAVWLRSLIGLFLSITVGFFGYCIVRTYSAEYVFYTSLVSAQANNGTQTYNRQVTAIQTNPYITRFHIIYSQTNLALATSLANSISQPDSKATAEEKTKDRELVAQLIQQSIKEAKAAVALNKSNILAWENMARIYQQLIDIAQGADAWADTSFKQAIALDPANPVLRLELGSVTMRAKNFTDAITHFQKSASLKPNYANAYYNLAYAYKAMGDTGSAIRALEQTQKLVATSSDDYTKVAGEIDMLKNAQSPTPTPQVKPTISPPVALPTDAGPSGLR